MNKSYLDDEETLNEMNEVKNLSINEILHGTGDNSDREEYTYLETTEEKLEFERDFLALSERLINHDLTQEDAEKKAVISMREYYTDDVNGCKDKEIDVWLKIQWLEKDGNGTHQKIWGSRMFVYGLKQCYYDYKRYKETNNSYHLDKVKEHCNNNYWMNKGEWWRRFPCFINRILYRKYI